MSDAFIHALRCPQGERPALADDTDRVTHTQLHVAARRAAGRIREEFGSGGYVLLAAEPSVRFIITLLGTMYSGNTPVPIDPVTPAPTLEAIRAQCRASRLLEPLAAGDCEHAPSRDAPDAQLPALVLFTSGTTGSPKGVLMTHQNLLRSCDVIAGYLGYHEFPTSVSVLPLHYSYGLISQVLSQLYVGGYVRIMAGLRNPLVFAKTVEGERIETFCGVPSTFLALTKFNRLAPIRLPALRVVCSAGAAFEASVYDTLKTICPNATVFNNYGMTEACPRLSYVSDRDEHFFDGSVGRPIAGVEAIVIDGQTDNRLPDNVRGVLAVRGPNISPGYLNDAVATRTAFTADGFLRTGDIAHIDAGYIYLHGRADDIFNVGGEKVAPLEIETALNQMPEIECSAVAGLQDAARGRVPVAFLKLVQPIAVHRITAALAQVLSPNKMPVAYYEVSSFPQTGNGKIQRRRLEPHSNFVIRRIE
ncbi:MAG: acyl--CoA ligase [Gammaproteobacteria bacterium]|nr:acyl--CoA ligase [Gammaproteobacteria bacterium]